MQTPSTIQDSTSEKQKKMVPPAQKKPFRLPDKSTAVWIRKCIVDSKASGAPEPGRYRIRQILQKNLDAFLEKNRDELPPDKVRILRAMSKCGTGELGYTVSYCPDCKEISFTPRSCGNSNCPCCGHFRREAWIAERRSEVIHEMSYYHLVFTVPHDLNPLIYNNQKLLLDLLFRAAQNALLDLSLEKHNIKPGIIMVLHTFGSSMTLHYHLHVLISAGGLTPDNNSFKKIKGFFLPVQKISGQYRKNFMRGLKRLYKKGKLTFNGTAEPYKDEDAFKALCDACYKFIWNVNLKKYGSYFEQDKQKDPNLPDVEDAITYFGRYANRTAITSSRIKEANEEKITFEYKDYHTDGSYEKKDMELSPEEFIRRFSLHILPKGFRKIRMAGYLSGNVRRKSLKRIHEILMDEYTPCMIRGMKSSEVMKVLFGKDPPLCPKCEKPMYSFFFNTDRMTIILRAIGEVEGRSYIEINRYPRGPDGRMDVSCPVF